MKKTILLFTAIFMLISPSVFADTVNITEKVKNNIEVKTSEINTELKLEDKTELNSEDKTNLDSEDNTELKLEDETKLNSEDKTNLDSKDNTELEPEDNTEAKEDSPEKILMQNLEKKIGKYHS